MPKLSTDTSATVAIIIVVLFLPIVSLLASGKRIGRAWRLWRYGSKLSKRELRREARYRAEIQARRKAKVKVSEKEEDLEMGLSRQLMEAGPTRQLSTAEAVKGWRETIAVPGRALIREHVGIRGASI
jgi:hypothetical protein